MLPAAGILLLFLTYPLSLGIWMGFTDARVGRPGVFIGLENFVSLFDDDVFWLSVFNTLIYTIFATIAKFGLGMWLALLLNHTIPFKAFIRAIVLLPYIVPTVLSAIPSGGYTTRSFRSSPGRFTDWGSSTHTSIF